MFELSQLLKMSVTALCLSTLLFVSAATAADYNSAVTATILKKTTLTGNGAKIIYPQTDHAEVTIMTVEVAPGGETGWHQHPIPVYAYVVAGTLNVQIDGSSDLTFSAGDAIIEVVNTLHNGRNRGTEPVRLVVTYLGIAGQPNVSSAGRTPSRDL